VVLVTGVCGGLGREALRGFRRAGAIILGADRHAAKLRGMKARGQLSDYVAGDLTDPAVQEQIIDRFGDRVDVLVNNVGGGFSRRLEDTTRADYLALWKLNFEVAAMLCRGIMPRMSERGGGKVINVSTILADNPLPTVSAYAASKAALIAFTRSVALQFAPLGVRANVLAPGYIENDKHASYFASAAGRQFQERFMPTGVTGAPDAVTGAFLYLASPLSDHMTGQVLKVDGGYSIW
jgi:NAD(P)-dependent dehydrogenase (short-subunit alcohol dehydrogenase family)